jgi:hypothetical protein
MTNQYEVVWSRTAEDDLESIIDARRKPSLLMSGVEFLKTISRYHHAVQH